MEQDRVRLIYFHNISDERGDLSVVEGGATVPFRIKRVFWFKNVPRGAVRGNHSHKKCEQVIVLMRGKVTTKIDGLPFFLVSSKVGLYVAPEEHVVLEDFSDDCICMVLCSEHYDPYDIVASTSVAQEVSA